MALSGNWQKRILFRAVDAPIASLLQRRHYRCMRLLQQTHHQTFHPLHHHDALSPQRRLQRNVAVRIHREDVVNQHYA